MSEIPPAPEPAPRLFTQVTDEETKKEQDQSVILNALVSLKIIKIRDLLLKFEI